MVLVESDAGSSLLLPRSSASVHDVTLTQDCTIDFTSVSGSDFHSFMIYLRQDSTGGHSVTWDSDLTIEWPGGGGGDEPDLTTDPDTLSILSFTTADGGSTWQGFLGSDDFA